MQALLHAGAGLVTAGGEGMACTGYIRTRKGAVVV